MALLAASVSVTSRVLGETLIVPVITLAERYDSNVFTAPKIAGVRQDDWVSTATPQLNVVHRGSVAQTTLQLSGIGERYINNPGLSYFGGGANFGMNLNRFVQEYVPRLSFTISNGTFYSPQAPAFNPGNIDADPDAFARGIQIVRVNTFTNSSSGTLSYAFDQMTSFRVSYSYSLIRFGHSFVNVGNAGIVDTDTQSINAGPQFRVSPQDTLSLNYMYQRTQFLGGQLPGFPSKYEAHGGTLGWLRAWGREVRTNVYAGASSVDQGGTALASGTSVANQSGGLVLAYTGGASLIYTDLNPTASGGGGQGLGGQGGVSGIGGLGGLSGPGGGSLPGGGAMGMVSGASKVISFNYSAGVFPSYYAGGVPLISHLVSGAVFRRMGTSWAVTSSADYAKSNSLSKQAGAGDIGFQSYGGNVSLSFFLTPTMFGSLTGDYHKFEGQGLGLAGVLVGGTSTFDRYIGMISITKLWY